MRDSLFLPAYIIRFIIFFDPSHLILTTFCLVDGLSSFVFIASSFLTVPASTFPVDYSERRLEFGVKGILLSTK